MGDSSYSRNVRTQLKRETGSVCSHMTIIDQSSVNARLRHLVLRILFCSFPHARTPTTHVFGREMSSELEPEVEELVLPGLVGKKDEEEKERADKEAGQKLKQLLLGGDSDGDSDTEDDDDVSQT